MSCEACGGDSPDGSKFCVHCGERLVAIDASPPPPPPLPPPPPAPTPFVAESLTDESLPDKAPPGAGSAWADADPEPADADLALLTSATSSPVAVDDEDDSGPRLPAFVITDVEPADVGEVPPPPLDAPTRLDVASPPIGLPSTANSSVVVAPALTPVSPAATASHRDPSFVEPSVAVESPPAPSASVEPQPLAPPEPESPVGVVDPWGFGPVYSRLSGNAQRAGRVAAAIVSVLLEEGEEVRALVQGRYQNQAGLVVLTDRRVLVANDHEWQPDIRTIPFVPDLVVQGWQDDRTASLVFVTEGQSVTVSLIVDRPLAQELAQLIRAKVAELAD